jgi:hypothetical protein
MKRYPKSVGNFLFLGFRFIGQAPVATYLAFRFPTLSGLCPSYLFSCDSKTVRPYKTVNGNTRNTFLSDISYNGDLSFKFSCTHVGLERNDPHGVRFGHLSACTTTPKVLATEYTIGCSLHSDTSKRKGIVGKQVFVMCKDSIQHTTSTAPVNGPKTQMHRCVDALCTIRRQGGTYPPCSCVVGGAVRIDSMHRANMLPARLERWVLRWIRQLKDSNNHPKNSVLVREIASESAK